MKITHPSSTSLLLLLFIIVIVVQCCSGYIDKPIQQQHHQQVGHDVYGFASVITSSPGNGRFLRLDRANANDIISFKILLHQSNINQLEEKFNDISNPKSKLYKQFMVMSEINQLVQVDQHGVDSVVSYLSTTLTKDTNFKVHSDYIAVVCHVWQAEHLFSTYFYQYKSLQSGLVRIRISGTAYLPISLKRHIQLVVGLSDFIEDSKLPKSIGSNLNQYLVREEKVPIVIKEPPTLTPQLIKQFYNVPNGLVGSNSKNLQAVAGFNDYPSAGALEYFASTFGLDSSLFKITLSGADCLPYCSSFESNLDLEYIQSMALNVSTLFMGMNNGGEWVLDWALAVEQVTPLPLVSSISYDFSEMEQCTTATDCSTLGYDNQQYMQRTNVEFMKLGAAGMSLLVASGDFGSTGLVGASGNCPINILKYCPLGGCKSKYSLCPEFTITYGNNSKCFFPAGIFSPGCAPVLSTQSGVDAINGFIALNSGNNSLCQASLETDTYGNYHFKSVCLCPFLKTYKDSTYTVKGYCYNKNDGALFAPYYPASSPYVTSVGGTIIPNLNRTSEIVCSIQSGSIITSGGGFSQFNPQPSYQASAVKNYLTGRSTCRSLPPSYSFNSSNRAYPDISIVSTMYQITTSSDNSDQCPCDVGVVDGTSAGTPTLAGMISLANDILLSQGKSQLGFLNPLLYQIAQTPSLRVFNDVVSGNNNCNTVYCCRFGWPAARGYDAASGLGTLNFKNFLNYVVNK